MAEDQEVRVKLSETARLIIQLKARTAALYEALDEIQLLKAEVESLKSEVESLTKGSP